MRQALGLHGVEGEIDVRELVVEERPEYAARQAGSLVGELLAGLVELRLKFRRRHVVLEDDLGHRESGPDRGLGTVVVDELLQALLQGVGDLALHLLGGGAGPGGRDRHDLDRERRVLGASELLESEESRAGQRDQQEQGDGPLADGERRKVEAAHRTTPVMLVGARRTF
ncbi:hypothetical protein M2437_002848 [Methylorubrum pseudosasae]|nr:hypothetical protein [Methylorubrum pseudosasae]